MMKKSIKYSTSFIIVALSIITSFVVYAEDAATTGNKPVACTMDAKICPDGSSVGRVGPNCEFAKCPGAINNAGLRNEENKIKREQVREETQIKREQVREENKGEITNIKNELEQRREAYKIKMNQMVELAKTKREEFKKELDLRKEESKTKIEEIKNTLKEKIAKIKDEKKKISAEKIVSNINDLNIKRTNELTNKINQIDNVLLSVNSRISKVENKILDIATLSSKQTAVTESISAAKTAILSQASKEYEVINTITDETALRVEMKKIRDSFNTDIKALNEKVKLAHTALRDLVTTIAKIPNVNEDEISNKVETDTNTTDTN